MGKLNPIPVICAIGGSDSSGGAGIQLDMRIVSSFQLYATCAITAITSQGPEGVEGIYPLPLSVIKSQLEAVFNGFPVRAIKTGMLVNGQVVNLVGEYFSKVPVVVVDPVFKAKSGAILLDQGGVEELKKFFHRITLLTPNAEEAEILTGISASTIDGMEKAAYQLIEKGVQNVLIKGGHLEDHNDILLLKEGDQVKMEIIKGIKSEASQVHGTGCAYASLITSYLVLSFGIIEAVKAAKAILNWAFSRTIWWGKGYHFFHPRGILRGNT